jgi:DNA polymerase I-like protein with 3'-5' exonuclease and polymerase domains
MSADWPLIRRSYEGSGKSLRRVAEQFGVSVSTLLKRAAREQWKPHRPADSVSGAQNGIRGINEPGLDFKMESAGGITPPGPGEFDSISEVQYGIRGINEPRFDSKMESAGGINPPGPGEFDSISGVQNGIRGINEPGFDSKMESTDGINPPGPDEFDSTPGRAWSIPESINAWDRLGAASFYLKHLGWAVHHLQPPHRGDEKERGKKPCSKGWRDHKAADVTPEDIQEVFSSRTPYNLGVVVRPPFVAVDLDSKPDSGASVRAWLASRPEFAAVPRERTGGGAHLHFICRDLPEGVLKSKKAVTCQIHEKVSAELYFDGLNLVLSPSVHKSGHRYTWEVTGPIPEVSWEQLRQWFGFEAPEAPKRGRPAKDAPWWSKWQEDLRTLDLVKVAGELGILGECLDPDTAKWAVRCPWHDQHSEKPKGEPGSDTVLFNAPGTLPAFRCLHSHCDGRGIREFIGWCEGQRPGVIAAHCTGLRVWQPGAQGSDGRPKLELPGTGRSHSEFAAELGAVIGPKLDLFQFSRNVVEITVVKEADARGAIPGAMLHTLKPADLVTAAERSVETGVLRQDEAGDSVFMSKSMAESDARVVLSARQFLSRLPRIVRLLDVPVPILHEGKVVYPGAGYDERFGTWLSPDAPKLRSMGFEEALRLLLGELYCPPEQGGFWWQDEQARVHALARLITPFCRGLMHWKRTPLWIYDGNREGCGKDTCADVTHVLYTGRSIICAPLNKDGDEEMRKRITSALMAGSRFFHLANMKGHVRYAALEAATDNSGIWEDRRLGVSETLVLPNETEFSFSANNATWEPDIERRCRRIRLRFTPEDINGHRYRQPNLLDWVRQNRSELLSAIAALVAHWVGNGCPPGPSPFTSFPEWGRVVGGIMASCGLPDPCQPHAESQSSGDQDTRAMRQFFGLGHERFGSEWTPKNTVYDWVREVEEVQELFDWIDFTQKRGMVSFAKLLAKFDGRELGGIVFSAQRTSANCCKYRFFRPSTEAALDLTPASSGSSTTVRCEVEGGFSSRSVCEEKNGTDEENKKHFKESLQKGLQNLTSPHTSLSAVFCSARSDLARICADLEGAMDIALDLETYGPGRGDALDPWKGEIRLLTLARKDGPLWCLDLRAIGYDLGPLVPILQAATLIAHKATFDLLWLRQKCGLRASRVFCTLTAARLLTAGTKPGNDLDKCLERYLGIAPAPDHSRSDWGSMFLTEDQLAYAARDVLHLQALSNKLWGLLEGDQLDVVGRLEFDLVPVIVEMEAAGIAVDKAKLREIETRARSSASDHAGMLRQKLNLPKLNPGSPQQLLEALKAAGIELENTNEETLKAADDGEIIPLIIDYRSAEKLAQQAASLLECVKQDGRIHGRFDPTGTATGRFSSKDPNLQNVRRGELRTGFVPEAGNKLIVADYSQIELRAAAVIAGEKKMIEAYKNGVDLHKQTASEVLNKPLDEVTKQDRQLSKATNFGLLYGQSAPGLVRYAASSYGVQMELDQAEQIRRQFFRTYDRLRQWHGVSHNQADAGAREVRTVLGRRRLIPETASEWERFTALVNTPVQGGCADGMKQALVLLAQRLPIEARLISTVHDEVLVEAPEAMANAVCDLVQATMIEAMAALFPQVPIEVEAGSCSNWGEK